LSTLRATCTPSSKDGHPTTSGRKHVSNCSIVSPRILRASLRNRSIAKRRRHRRRYLTVRRLLVFQAIQNGCGTASFAAPSDCDGSAGPTSCHLIAWATSVTRWSRGRDEEDTRPKLCVCCFRTSGKKV